MTDPRIQDFTTVAAKAVEHLHAEYAKLQTGRASAALVEHIMVDAYGQKQELRAVAGISLDDARTIVVQPWDNGILTQVEAALQQADLGCSPLNDGSVLRLNLPPMTEERRKDLVKVVHQQAEESRISIRQHRDKARDNIKEEADEDVRYTLLEELDKAAHDQNEAIEQAMKAKEEEVMTV